MSDMSRTKQAARKSKSNKSPRKQSNKRKSSDFMSDDGFDANDSDISDRPTKRTKPTSSSSPLQRHVDGEGNPYWDLTKMRRVTVSEYKGKQMVSVREYYEANGKVLPGKKGISMPMDQYSALIQLLPQIEQVLSKKGETVPRPQYDGVKTEDDEAEEEEENVKQEADDDDDHNAEVGVNSRGQKSNFEATSDEDED